MSFDDFSAWEKTLIVLMGGWALFGWMLGPGIYVLPFVALFAILGVGAALEWVLTRWRSRGARRRTGS